MLATANRAIKGEGTGWILYMRNRNKSTKGTVEEVVYSRVKKDELGEWYIVYRCKQCDQAAQEFIIDIPQFSWEDWKLGIDQKVRICHHCDRQNWYYSTVIIKGKHYGTNF